MNMRLILMPWGFEIHRRIVDTDPKSSFKQFGAGVGVTIQNYLGRELTLGEELALDKNGYVEV